MFSVIMCTNCNKSGNFELKLTFTYKMTKCKCCRNFEESKWRYWFCNIDCLDQWYKDTQIKELGYPCEDCRNTGFAFGFESNGVCKICRGTKRVKERVETQYDRAV